MLCHRPTACAREIRSTKATFAVAGPFPCKATVRGDYEDLMFVFELENVRRYGMHRAQLALDDFTHDVLDEFGTYVLGADDAFEKRLQVV